MRFFLFWKVVFGLSRFPNLPIACTNRHKLICNACGRTLVKRTCGGHATNAVVGRPRTRYRGRSHVLDLDEWISSELATDQRPCTHRRVPPAETKVSADCARGAHYNRAALEHTDQPDCPTVQRHPFVLERDVHRARDALCARSRDAHERAAGHIRSGAFLGPIHSAPLRAVTAQR